MNTPVSHLTPEIVDTKNEDGIETAIYNDKTA